MKKNNNSDRFKEESFEETDEFASFPEDEKIEVPEEIILPYVIELKYPIGWGGAEKRKTVIIKRRLTAKDVMNIPSENIKLGHMVTLVKHVTGESQAFINEMDTLDLFKCIEVVKNFLPGSRETGGERLTA